MKDYCNDLKRLYSEIPKHGYEIPSELNRIYVEAKKIILSIASQGEDEEMKQKLEISSIQTDNLITEAVHAKTKKDREYCFKRAVVKLGNDIRTAIELIKCQ